MYLILDSVKNFLTVSFVLVPNDTNRLLTLAVLADVCATLGDDSGATALFDLLLPHSGRQVILNCFTRGGSFWGPVATHVGRLASVMGQDAEPWFAQARAEASAFESPLALARVPTT